MKLQDLQIARDDFSVFLELAPREKVEFLSDASEHGIEESIIKQIDNLASRFLSKPPFVETKDFQVGEFKLSVTMLPDEIHLNSNSLRAIRKFVSKLWNDGMLLSKLNTKKTIFDIYRYYKAYKIIGRGTPICPN
tara:strand:- start:368 stop:772 length:405 start_codon:yes stop_codon:yes gene_type:complete